MKNFLIAALTVLVCLLLGAIFYFGTPLKWPNKGSAIEDEPVTKEWVQAEIANQIEPTFDDVDMLLHYQYLEQHKRSIDSAFLAMSPELIKQVATVCIKRDGFCTPESVVLDFRANSQIYNNLPAADTNTSNVEYTEDPMTHSSGGLSYRHVEEGDPDTIVINGKKYVNHGKTD